MPTDTRVVQPFYWLLGSAAAVVVIAGLRAAQSLVVPFLIAAFLAVICTPALHWLRKRKVPNWLSIMLVAVAITLVVLVLVTIMTGSINQFVVQIPTYQKNLHDKQEKLEAQMEGWLEKFSISKKETEPEKLESDVPEELELIEAENNDSNTGEVTVTKAKDINIEETAEEPFSIIDHFLDKFNSQIILPYVGEVLMGITGVFSNLFLVLLTVLFMLLESSGMPNKLRAMSQRAENLDILDQAEKVRDSIVKYISLKTFLSLLTSILVGIFVWYLQIDSPMLWALLAFFLNFIPNIGSIIAAIPPMLIAFVQYDLQTMLITAIGYVVINVVIGNVLEPRVMGKGLGLSTLVVFVSLVFWAWVLGPVGMLFSVPLTMIVKIVMESFDETRWLAILVGANPETSD